MDKHNHLANNLNAIKEARHRTLSEFSKEIGIPKSTLQYILTDGQTTLDTAMRISSALHIPLDALVTGALPAEELALLSNICESFAWFSTLEQENKDTVVFYLNKLLDVLRR